MTQFVQPLTTLDFASRATFLSCRTTLRSELWTADFKLTVIANEARLPKLFRRG
jgi:hypothetical protein